MKGVKKISKEGLRVIEKANDLEYETRWEDGVPLSKKKTEILKGKKSRSKGRNFELKVRHDLEGKGFILDKWSNNVDLIEGKLIIAKKKFNPFFKAMTLGTGFPDFVAFSYVRDGLYRVIGIEVKTNGILSKEEKEKCQWYLEKGIFSDIWIASGKKNEKKTEIEYVDFKERYSKK